MTIHKALPDANAATRNGAKKPATDDPTYVLVRRCAGHPGWKIRIGAPGAVAAGRKDFDAAAERLWPARKDAPIIAADITTGLKKFVTTLSYVDRFTTINASEFSSRPR